MNSRSWQKSPQAKGLLHKDRESIISACGAGVFACAGLRAAGTRRGITLIEMLVVVTLISLAVAISFPAVTSGLDSLRLHQAVRDTVSLFDAGLSRAQRSQQVVEITVSPRENALWIRAPESQYERKMELPDGVSITRVLPGNLNEDDRGVRSFYLYPGGSVPRFGIEMRNRRGQRRVVSVDPITGVPRISDPMEAADAG
jgi:prepilin-type N-terminal cleavage/methylation domain-containing protein